MRKKKWILTGHLELRHLLIAIAPFFKFSKYMSDDASASNQCDQHVFFTFTSELLCVGPVLRKCLPIYEKLKPS